MPYSLPHPAPILISDAAYSTKLQANSAYIEDLMRGLLRGTDLAAAAGLANEQFAEKGLVGSKIATGANGIPTEAIQDEASGEPAQDDATIVEADLADASVAAWKSGMVDPQIIVCQKTFTVAGASTTCDFTFATDAIYKTADFTAAPTCIAMILAATAPSNDYGVELLGSTAGTASFAVYGDAALATWAITLLCIAVGA